MAFDSRKNAGHLVAKGNGCGLLQVAAADDGRIAVVLGQLGQRGGDVLQIRFDERQAFADLQHGGRVGDVLRGGTPVAIFTQAVFAGGVDLVHHSDDGVTNGLGFGFQLGPIDLLKIAVFDDFCGGLGRDDAQLALHLGQGAFDVQVFGGAVFVRPNLAHGGIAEDVAENFAVNDGSGHGGLLQRGGGVHGQPAFMVTAPQVHGFAICRGLAVD